MILNPIPSEVTKKMLSIKGTVVILQDGADDRLWPECRRKSYVVKDLFDRKQFNRPDCVGVGPADRGIAFHVRLDQIKTIIIP